MNIGAWDIKLLAGSLLLMIFISLVFPQLGLITDSEANITQNDIPEADFSRSQIELISDRPQYPRSPTSGEVRYYVGASDAVFQTQIYDSDTKGVYIMTFIENDNPIDNNPTVDLDEIEIIDSTTVNVGEDNITLTEQDFENQNRFELSTDNYTLRIQASYVENWGTNDIEYGVRWELLESPDDGGLFENIPILGEAAQIADQVITVAIWFVSTVLWFFAWILESSIQIIIIVLFSLFYLFDILQFVVNQQILVIDNAPSFVGLLLLVVNVTFLSLLAKFILVATRG